MNHEEYLKALGIPDCPPEIAAEAKNVEEADLMGLLVTKLVEECTNLLALAQRLQKRCRVCEGDKLCAHCIADGQVIQNTMLSAAAMVQLSAAATVPGSRIAAQREARTERNATKG